MKKLLPIGMKVKINCTYPWQATEAVIVETPAEHLDIPDDHPYSLIHGQWMNDGENIFHFPFSRFEAIEQGARASPLIQEEAAPELTGESCFDGVSDNTDKSIIRLDSSKEETKTIKKEEPAVNEIQEMFKQFCMGRF